jgi:myosin heavy subunit
VNELNQTIDELRSAQVSLSEVESQKLELQHELETCKANVTLIEAQLQSCQFKLAQVEEEKRQWHEDRTSLMENLSKAKADEAAVAAQSEEKLKALVNENAQLHAQLVDYGELSAEDCIRMKEENLQMRQTLIDMDQVRGILYGTQTGLVQVKEAHLELQQAHEKLQEEHASLQRESSEMKENNDKNVQLLNQMKEKNDKNVQLLNQQEGVIQELEQRCDNLEQATRSEAHHAGSNPFTAKRDGIDVQIAHRPGHTDVETQTSTRQGHVDAGETQNEDRKISSASWLNGVSGENYGPEDLNTEELCHDIPLQVQDDMQGVGEKACQMATDRWALPQRSMHGPECVVDQEKLVLTDHLYQVLLRVFARL